MSMAKTFCVVALASGFAASALTDLPAGTRRILQFENESVRVWKSLIAPGQPLSLHRHERGERHGDVNEGGEPIEVMVVELVARTP